MATPMTVKVYLRIFRVFIFSFLEYCCFRVSSWLLTKSEYETDNIMSRSRQKWRRRVKLTSHHRSRFTWARFCAFARGALRVLSAFAALLSPSAPNNFLQYRSIGFSGHSGADAPGQPPAIGAWFFYGLNAEQPPYRMPWERINKSPPIKKPPFLIFRYLPAAPEPGTLCLIAHNREKTSCLLLRSSQ